MIKILPNDSPIKKLPNHSPIISTIFNPPQSLVPGTTQPPTPLSSQRAPSKVFAPRGVDPNVSRCRCGSHPGTSWLLYLEMVDGTWEYHWEYHWEYPWVHGCYIWFMNVYDTYNYGDIYIYIWLLYMV